ncbi:MAG: cupredoxin domain-containing protein [Nanoarchaeota archaeon]
MKNQVIVGIIILAIVIIGGIYWSMSSTSPDTTSTSSSLNSTLEQSSANAQAKNSVSAETKVINVKALSFTYEPKTITVKKGEKVKLIIDNSDKTHGIVIPNLSVSGIDSVEFTADKAGTFEFKCPTMCGSGHRDMKGTLVVEE